MPPQSSDPESYSLEEMMQRLRKRETSQGEPELVTREDGSQVLRVKKRKRRTKQPQREAEKRKARARVIQIAALVGLVMCVAIVLLGLLTYYNSRSFQQRLLDRLYAITGADVEFFQFRVTPSGAFAQSASMSWPDHPELRELRMNIVNADLRPTSFIGGVWSGEEVVASSGTLVLGKPPPGVQATEIPQSGTGSKQSPFRYSRYRCDRLQVLFGSGNRPPMQARDLEASIYPVATGYQLRLSGGTLAANGWPELRLDRALIEFGLGDINVSSLRFTGSLPEGAVNAEGMAWSNTDGETSVMECQGSFNPRSSRQVFLEATCDRFPSEALLGKAFSRLFTSVIDGKGSLAFVPRDFASHELVLPFEASPSADGAYLGGLPFLDVLKTELKETRFAQPQFQNEAEGVLRRRNGAIELADLRLEQNTFLAIRGRIVAEADGRLTGRLEVGVADRLMSSDTARNLRLAFTETRDGYCWVQVNLSGTVQSPKDDFAQTLKQVYQTEDAPGDPKDSQGQPVRPPRDPGREFEDLIKGTGSKPEKGQK